MLIKTTDFVQILFTMTIYYKASEAEIPMFLKRRSDRRLPRVDRDRVD